MRNFFLTSDDYQVGDQFVLFYSGEIIVRDDQFIWSMDEVSSLFPHVLHQVLIQRDSGLVAIDLAEDAPLPESASQVSLRSLLFNSEDALLTAGKANQVLDWYRAHRFCGYCGAQTSHGENELVVVCERCQHHFFPRINPCVIVLVTRGEQILLARSARYRTGFYSCLAGFIEVGESAEDTVHREVKEESGLEIENVRYFKSQSWPFPSQLMLGYYADYKSGEIVPEPGEIEEADWFSVDKLPKTPSGKISVAGQLIDNFVRHMQ